MTLTLPARLSTNDFHRAVLALAPRTAVFDCDGTLWSGDAGYDFMVWSIKTGLVSRNAATGARPAACHVTVGCGRAPRDPSALNPVVS